MNRVFFWKCFPLEMEIGVASDWNLWWQGDMSFLFLFLYQAHLLSFSYAITHSPFFPFILFSLSQSYLSIRYTSHLPTFSLISFCLLFSFHSQPISNFYFWILCLPFSFSLFSPFLSFFLSLSLSLRHLSLQRKFFNFQLSSAPLMFWRLDWIQPGIFYVSIQVIHSLS